MGKNQPLKEEKKQDVLDLVNTAYERARGFNLQIEVFAHAMTYLKRNRTATIEEALTDALIEWDL